MEIQTRIHGVAGNNETDSACRSILLENVVG
jgi:hypothetical protein